MSKKERSLTNYTYTVNFLHIALCLIIYFLRNLGVFNSVYVSCAVFAAELILWFTIGLAASLGLNTTRSEVGFRFAFFAVLPITLVTVSCAVLGIFFTPSGYVSWTEFFFLGSAVNFFHKPAVFAAGFFSVNAYYIYFANILVMFLLAFIGSLCGASANKTDEREKKKGKAKTNDKADKEKRVQKAKLREEKENKKLKKAEEKAEKIAEKNKVIDTTPEPLPEIEKTPEQKNEAAILKTAAIEAGEEDTDEQISLFEFQKIELDEEKE